MNRPPYPRNKSAKSRSGRKPGKRSIRGPLKQRRLGLALVLIVLFSLYQYFTTGSVTWPGMILGISTDTVNDYATRPEAGWRRATESLETIGAAREGQPIPDFDLTGRVVRVADGDTVSVLDRHNKQHKVRLYAIDTPERDQPHGKAAREALARLVADRQVGVVVVEKDSYGRTVGTLYQGDTNINVTMVATGNAWWYRHYAPHNRKLEASEKLAKEQGLGLWAGSRPVPPWDWRRGRR